MQFFAVKANEFALIPTKSDLLFWFAVRLYVGQLITIEINQVMVIQLGVDSTPLMITRTGVRPVGNPIGI